ncbi:Rab geranylgeranyltransferase subunit beta BET2 [Aspergillus stella-maris]|uniref:Rab geranylgeranyltransferase subunit beta BET2 n=1 Tax=Aspergillus stella-maris TaxID=1810926 RepID=UPI003CCDE2A7
MSLVSGPGKAAAIPSDQKLCPEKHIDYIKKLDSRKDELEYWLTEHLRLNGVYWGLTALHLLGCPDGLPRDNAIDFVLSCQQENGGFSAAPGHDAHMLYTVSAVQLLVTLDAVDELDKRGLGGKQKVGSFIAGLQDKETGSFMGDEWGELDTRFLYGALNALSLLGLLDLVDMDKAVSYVQKCENLDGGYGVCPGAESHSGQVFTCVGALAIAGRLDLVDKDRLGAWLSERQLDHGGLNGRPEKLADACYSWWVGASLAMIDKLDWVNGAKLASFILSCQDSEAGGFADRPDNAVDVFHTLFAIAGLSLLGFEGIAEVDPVYCMPKAITEKALST